MVTWVGAHRALGDDLDDEGGGDYGIPEHHLAPSDRATFDPALMRGDIVRTRKPWGFPARHLAEGAPFTDPFIGPEIFPELSAGTSTQAERVRFSKAIDYTQRVDLNLYLLQVHLPAFVATDSNLTSLPRVDMDLLAPWTIGEHHRFGLLLGLGVPTRTASDGVPRPSQRFQLTYAIANDLLDLQLRGGYGFQTLPGATDQTARVGQLLYGGLASVAWADWGRAVVEVNGLRAVASRQDDIDVVPGFRFFPADDQSIQLGIGGLLHFARGTKEDVHASGFGGLVDLSYNFL